jgi:hypothetical protein
MILRKIFTETTSVTPGSRVAFEKSRAETEPVTFGGVRRRRQPIRQKWLYSWPKQELWLWGRREEGGSGSSWVLFAVDIGEQRGLGIAYQPAQVLP